MENTTTNPTPITPAPVTQAPSNKKLALFTVLLVLGAIFWLWSLSYRNSHHKMEDGSMMRNDTPSMTEESDLNSEIDASMQSDSEIELKEIDGEF